MKKIFFILLIFIFIFSFSCGNSSANTGDSKKTDGVKVPEINSTEPLPAEEFNEPQILQDVEVVTVKYEASSVFKEFIKPENFNEIVIAKAEPVIIEHGIPVTLLSEPVIIEDSIPVTKLPESVAAVIETPSVKKEQEIQSVPEVQIRPQAVPDPQPLVPQIPARPVQETALTAPAGIVEEKPSQTAGNPAEEKPIAPESSPSVPAVVSALKNEPVIPHQTLPVIPPDGEIIYSRTVRAITGQMIEIPFRGTGWVYQGELASRRGISYDSRRLDPEGQSFIFRVTEAGTYSLKFFKEDFIRDYILNDHVMVITGETPQANSGWFNSPQDRGRVIAQPRWPAALDEAEMRRGGISAGADDAKTSSGSVSSERQEAENRTVILPQPQRQDMETQNRTSSQSQNQGQESQNTTSTRADDATEAGTSPFSGNPDELLQKAKEAFGEGKVQTAISFLDQYKYFFPSGSDEAYWLYGQFYEANTPSRNILLALDYYKRLVNEYPQSRRCNEARSRIRYLERFYININ
ncbi:MAG: hypothetical protein LBB81_00890 [Treponema sp.]|jgi:hypothetical protein|nr:hypothetical protein [Treponema sp.]